MPYGFKAVHFFLPNAPKHLRKKSYVKHWPATATFHNYLLWAECGTPDDYIKIRCMLVVSFTRVGSHTDDDKAMTFLFSLLEVGHVVLVVQLGVQHLLATSSFNGGQPATLYCASSNEGRQAIKGCICIQTHSHLNVSLLRWRLRDPTPWPMSSLEHIVRYENPGAIGAVNFTLSLAIPVRPE